MADGIVFDIMKFSTRDGPGIRTTVFFKGCPLNCQWCHNPESQSIHPELMSRPNLCVQCHSCLQACPRAAISVVDGKMVTDLDLCTLCGDCVSACYAGAREIVGRSMSVDQVLSQVERDIPFYDQSGGGVTFSGGEAVYQPEFLLELLRACRQKGIHTALDTSGCIAWEKLDIIRAEVDLFLYDLKLMDSDRHRQYTGVTNTLILDNLRRLSEAGEQIILRFPLIPGVNDSLQSVQQMGAFAASLPYLLYLEVLPYHLAGVEKYRRLCRPYPLSEIQPPSSEHVEKIVQTLRGFGLNVLTGG